MFTDNWDDEAVGEDFRKKLQAEIRK